jgi:CubicO group peptidase (beta-lactamase class C family)
MLRCASIYGSSNDPRYIAVWLANPGFAKWHALARVNPGDYRRVFQAQTQIPEFRPAGISIASDQSVCAAFTDEGIGAWAARHGMTAGEYQAELKRQTAAGFMPISVQGGGSGNGVRYAAIFAKQDRPLARQWTVAGRTELAAFDDLVRAFMTKHAARGAQLTIAQKGDIKLQRAYTWAEPGYRAIAVSDRFMLASNSKMFVAAAVQKLYDLGRLQSTAHAYALLGFKGPKDPRSDTITVAQLLDHTAGYTYDPTYDMRRIALARGLRGPAGKRDIAAQMYSRDLDYAPGSPPGQKASIYNNYGYLLASLVVERVTGQDYVQFLRSQVLLPDGISEVSVYPTAAASLPPGLAPIDDGGLGLSALAPHSNAQVPVVFGGDGMVKETAVGSCGLAASATAMTRFIQRHAAWGIGGRRTSARAGSTPGSSTWAQSRNTGTDWALVINTRIWAPGSGNAFSGLVEAINAELARQGL